MIRRILCSFPILIVAFVPATAPALAAPNSPMALLKERDVAVRKYLEKNPLPLNPKQRGYIENQLNDLFDYRTIALESLGKHDGAATKQQLEEYIQVFTEVTRRNSSSEDALKTLLEGTIRYEDEEKRDNGTILVTTVVEKNDEEIIVEYVFVKNGDSWKVVDYVLDDVGLIENYRSSFGKIITENGFAELIKKLKEKLK